MLGLAGMAAAQPVTVICPPTTNITCPRLPFTVVPVTVTVCNTSGASADVFWSVNGQPVETNAVPTLPPPGCTNLTYLAALPPGTNTVDVQVVSAVGLAANCSSTVLVTPDSQPPTLVCPTLLTGAVNNLCLAEIPRVKVQVSDNCAGPGEIAVTQSPPFGTQVSVGTNWITITATDPQGNLATCQVPFVVLDPTPPTVSCPPTLTLAANAGCQAVLPALSPTVADDCTPSSLLTITQTPPPGTLLAPGNHLVTIAVSDTSGHTVTCQTAVTVLDTTPPVLTCPTNLVLSPGTNCQVTLPALNVSASDACTPSNQLVVTQSPAAGTVLPTGTHTVTVTVCDAVNNCSSCTVLVTVLPGAAASWTWSRAGGGTNHDFGRGIARLPNGDLVVVGDFEGTATFGSTTLTSAGGSDLVVARLTPAGSLVWAVSGGGPQNEVGRGVATDAAGNIYVCGDGGGGVIFGSLTVPPGAWIAKLDGSGNFLWVRQFSPNGMAVRVAAQPGTNGICVAGWFVSGFSLPGIGLVNSTGGGDSLVVALDSAGNYQWAWTAGCVANDGAHAVAVAANGDVLVTGPFGSGPPQAFNFGGTILNTFGDRDVFVARLSSSGTLLWATNAGGMGEDVGMAVATDALGNVYVAGDFKPWGFANTAQFGSTILTCAGSQNIFVTKLSASGQFLWATNAGGGYFDFARDIAVTPGGQSFVTGHTWNGTFGANTVVGTGSEAFVAKLDPAGQFMWVVSGGGPGDDGGNGIALDGSGNCVFVTGSFATGPADFPPTPALPGAGGDDAFVARLCQTCATNTPPAVQCPPPITLTCASAAGSAAAVHVVVSDADGDALTVVWTANGAPVQTNNLPAGSAAPNTVTLNGLFPPGTNVVTMLVTDPSGAAAACTTWVIVLPDTTPPSLMCKGIIKLYASQNCEATLPALMPGSMSDNCTPASQLAVTQNPPPGTVLGLGVHYVLLTVTDAAGNSAVCVRTVWVLDNLPPVIQCPPTLVVTACQATIPNLTGQVVASDNCSSNLLITQLPPPGTPVGPGSYQIVLTATDAAGNSASCATTFTVQPTGMLLSLPLFNTGVDAAGNVLPFGSLDSHFLLVQSPDTNWPGPNAVVNPPLNMPPGSTSSAWICPAPPKPSGLKESVQPGVYVYRTGFVLPAGVSCVITGRWAADNAVALWLNGQPTGNAITAWGGAAFQQWHAFQLNSGFVAGTNVVDFFVTNFGVTVKTPSGLRVEWAGTINPCPPTCFPPFIVQQPISQTLPWSSFAVLSVTASGSLPLYYQWFKNGSPLPGATASSLVLSPLSYGHQGHYAVVVSNACGVVTSQVALVLVKAKKPGLIGSWSFRHPDDPFAADVGEPLEFIPSPEFLEQPELGQLAVVSALDMCPPPEGCPGLFGGRDAPVLRINPWFDGTLRIREGGRTIGAGQVTEILKRTGVMDLWLDRPLEDALLLWKDDDCDNPGGAVILWPDGSLQLAGQRTVGIIRTNQGHRVVLVSEEDPTGTIRYQLYVDGRPVLEAAAGADDCAGPNLRKKNKIDVIEGIGRAQVPDRPVYLGGLQLYDRALSREEIALLGSPETTGLLELVEPVADDPTRLEFALDWEDGAPVLRLNWTGTGFVLQETDDLSRPENWRDSLQPVRSVGATGPVHNEVSVSLPRGSGSPGPGFYRLKTKHDTVKNSIMNIR